jgi:GNAT superfamily N-acetyltransferase
VSPEPAALFTGDGWTARLLGEGDLPAIETVMQASLDFLELESGVADSGAAAIDVLRELPPEKTLLDKLTIGIFTETGELAGVLDAIRDYPGTGVWWIGLLLFRREWRGRGLGAQALAGFEQVAREAGASEIRLGVIEPNQDGYRFWSRMGFEDVERRPPRLFGVREHVVIVMRKGLAI